MRRLAVVSVLFISTLIVFGQDMQRMEVHNENRGSTADRDKPEPPPTAEELKYGQRMLGMAEADAGGLQGGMRAFALLQIARANRTNNNKAAELLDNAFTATREMDDDGRLQTRTMLQVEILQAMVPLAPDRAEELLVQIDADHRAQVLQTLLANFEKTKQLDRAIAVIERISAESEFPYSAAAGVMAVLPKEKGHEFNRLFTMALASYRDHSNRPARYAFPSRDLGLLVQRFWKQLPPEQVMEAITEILKQAQAGSDSPGQKDQPLPVSFASQNGSVSFSSYYKFRLFELLPIIRELDASQAESLLKKNQEVNGLLKQYPDGVQSVLPSDIGPKQGGGPRRAGVMSTVGGPPDPAFAQRMQQFEKMSKLVADADAHPDQALANVGTLQDKSLRANALLEIARKSWKKDSGTAKSALKQLREISSDLEPQEQAMLIPGAADIYLNMGETDDAKKVVAEELTAAEKMYKQDTNADDPNKALKAYWPSTNTYRSALRAAGRISRPWAFTLLKEISDPEVRFTAEMSLAGAWLHLPVGSIRTVTATKNGEMMNIMQDQ